MIVCICKCVSDRAVRAARDAGARTIEAVGATTGAGTGCGCCRATIATILAEPGAGAEPGGCRAGAASASAESVPRRIAADRLDTP